MKRQGVIAVLINGRRACHNQSPEQLADQCIAFARRLSTVHELYREISMIDGDGEAAMRRQPLVWDARLKLVKKIEASLTRNKIFARALFWNRQMPHAGYNTYCIHGCDTSYVVNTIVLDELPVQLHAPDTLRAILQAVVEELGADDAVCYSRWQGDPIWARHWLLWLKDGMPWPTGSDNRFQDAQGPHSQCENWLGGKLYIWPEYEPWKYTGPEKT
jgi:hypothetical protein